MPRFTVQRARVTFDQLVVVADDPDAVLDLVENDADKTAHVMRIDDPDGEVVWARQGLVVLPTNSKGVIKS